MLAFVAARTPAALIKLSHRPPERPIQSGPDHPRRRRIRDSPVAISKIKRAGCVRLDGAWPWTALRRTHKRDRRWPFIERYFMEESETVWSAAYAGPRSRHLAAVGVRDSARRVAGAAVSVMLGSEASIIRVVAHTIDRSRVPVWERPPVLIRRNPLEIEWWVRTGSRGIRRLAGSG